MVSFTYTLSLLLLLPALIAATYPLRQIFQFPTGTWIENIAVRWNGHLLITLVNTPELWEINPYATECEDPATLIHHFDGAKMLNGITELQPDVFAVIASNVVWEVTFNPTKDVSLSKVRNFTDAGVLNGMATLDVDERIVLISDSRLGLVWRLDMDQQTAEVVLQDETMSARTGRRSLIGINGIKIVNDYVYYNNCPGRLYCRVLINNTTGEAVGEYETIVEGPLADDIAVTPDGVGYLAGLDDNVITRVWQNGTTEVIAGNLNSSALAGATAAAFGRTARDQKVLYITTGGGEAAPVNGTYVEGGKVMALYL